MTYNCPLTTVHTQNKVTDRHYCTQSDELTEEIPAYWLL